MRSHDLATLPGATFSGAAALAVLIGCALPSTARGAPAAVPLASAVTGTGAADAFAWQITGAFSVWGLTQRNFFLGADHPLDDSDVVVQNFRLQAQAGTRRVGGVLRLDLAQGWWGVDNSPDVTTQVGTDANGAPTGTAQYNAYGLFRDKDTNYPVHVDHAYVYAELPWLPLRVEVGRQFFGVGHLLVLDQDLDGVRARFRPRPGLEVQGFWTKVSEGFQSYRLPGSSLLGDEGAFADADLFGAVLQASLGKHELEAFALRYDDRIPGWDYFPQGFGYLQARFQPQVTDATALGVRLAGRFDVAGGLTYGLEADYLVGHDDVANADYAGNLLDRNDGDLRGYNLYLRLAQQLELGLPVDVGLVAGLGSGDADPTGGDGNLNRIQTMGQFALTHVWEDSIMTDVGGISPQGLGSPASRGYRELENTTVVQVRAGVQPCKGARLDASYSWLRATEPVHGFDAKGPTTQTARDLGHEIDVDLTLWPLAGLSYKLLFGWFETGDAAALLIDGNTARRDDAWEIKHELLYKF